MRKMGRWAAGGALFVGLLSGASYAGASSPRHPAPERVGVSLSRVPSTGGAVVIRVARPGATECGFTAVPKVGKFNARLRCRGGTFRVLRVPANLRYSPRKYSVRVVAFGPARSRAITTKTITEAGAPKPTAATVTAPPISTQSVAPTAPAPQPIVIYVAPPAAATTTVSGGSGAFTGGGGGSASPPPTSSTGSGTQSPAGGSSSSGGNATTSVRAAIDPSYALADANGKTDAPTAPPVWVTFSYSATSGSGSTATIPNGTLTLAVLNPTLIGGSQQCVANVGGSTAGSTCSVQLPAWGTYKLITTYSSSNSTVSSTGQTESVDVEPPSPSPITVDETWGSGPTQPTATVSGPAASAKVTVTDANWVGLSTVPLADNLGDTCSATISGSDATCTMALSGTPSNITVAFPGASVTTTQPYTAWGINQTQTVNQSWSKQAASISGPNLSVSLQTATVEWNGGYASGYGTGWSGNPPANPLAISVGGSVELEANVVGNVAGDTTPVGYLAYSVSGPSTYSEYDQMSLQPNCSASRQGGSLAIGSCRFTFTGTGTYVVSIGFVSQDNNYASVPDALTETIDVS